MGSVRIQRVSELLKRELGEIIRREIPVSDSGLITVNAVEVASDLHTASVFVGVLGQPAQRQKALKLLEDQRKHLQALLARSVILKFTPQLRFVLDESIERGNRVLEILDEIEQSQEKNPQP